MNPESNELRTAVENESVPTMENELVIEELEAFDLALIQGCADPSPG